MLGEAVARGLEAIAGIQRGTASGDPGESAPSGSSPAGIRVLFDVNHPAHVHLFRHAIAELERRGHETFVASREKEVTVDLLDAYGIDHEPLTTRGTSLPGLVWEQLRRELRLLSLARRFRPDVIVGRPSPAAAHVSALVGARYVVVDDTEIDPGPIRLAYQAATFPFVDTVCAPPALDLPVPDADRRSLPFQELAYLHPRYFEPDPDALAEHGVDPDAPYFVVRLAGWDAYHDVGHRGLSPEAARELVSILDRHGTVYLSAEADLPPDLAAHELSTPPALLHQLLYHADGYVGDSGTTSAEAAVLGTPAIRTNTMAEEDEEAFRKLEERYGLLRSFADEDRAIAAVRSLVDGGIDRERWRERRARLVSEQPDVTGQMVDVILEGTGRPGDGRVPESEQGDESVEALDAAGRAPTSR